MTVLIQDTARNTLPTWTERALAGGYSAGAVLSPFTSPVEGNGYKISALQAASRVTDAGGQLWFDAQTHALQMPNVGDFRYYDGWGLWESSRNDLTTAIAQSRHAERVFEIQDELGAPRLAPTILLSSASGLLPQLSVDIAAISTELGGADTWITIAGDSQFWSAGIELDALIGQLAQLNPKGWYLTVARATHSIPVGADPLEVFGLLRTVLALSADAEVVVAHGDLAGLPAIAAGARTVGTGWDVRQRVLAYSDYVERASEDTQGSWFKRPTLEGLVGVVPRSEYEVLHSEDPGFAATITPGRVGDRPEEAFIHHATVLSSIISELAPLAPRERTGRLLERYAAAELTWAQSNVITGASIGPRQWIEPYAQALQLLSDEEGW